MLVRFLKPFRSFKPGQQYQVAEAVGRKWLAYNLVERVEEEPQKKPRKAAAPKAKKAVPDAVKATNGE